MPRPTKLTPEQIETFRAAHNRGETWVSLAANAGVSTSALKRSVDRITARTRTADEFKNTQSSTARPRVQPNVCGWNVEAMRKARDDQMLGQFAQPVQLAKAMRTDDALFNAWNTRMAPQSAVRTQLIAAPGARGESVARLAKRSCHVSRGTLGSIHATMVDHGIAIGHNIRETLDDGSRVNMRQVEWPLEFVRWNPFSELLETSTSDGQRVNIIHGNGEWTVYQKFDVLPWTKDACLLPGSLLWGAHAFGAADWAAASKSHGQAKILGKMPSGSSLQRSVDGAIVMTAEARDYLAMLQRIVSGEDGAGIAPFGSETAFLANGSNAWQVFDAFLQRLEKAAMRSYTGTDATLGSQGGAPGVDIATLFGVATTKIQGDFEALEQGLLVGLYQPWTAINFGDSHLAPRLEYQMPDPDADRKSADRASARTRLTNAIKEMRDQQLTVDQPVVDALALELGVSPAPQLAAAGESSVTVVLAPTDVAKVVRGSEARASQGLPPFGDERDNMTITEIDAAALAKATAPPVAAPPAPEAPPAPSATP